MLKHKRCLPCKTVLLIWLSLLAMLLTACGGDAITPEERVAETIRLGEVAVEERSLDSFSEYVAENYWDDRHANRKALLQTIAYYFFRNQSIHLLVDINEIKILSALEAEADLFVGMAGSPVEDSADAFLRADLLRLKIRFVKNDGVWQAVTAEWHRATPEEYRDALL